MQVAGLGRANSEHSLLVLVISDIAVTTHNRAGGNILEVIS